MDTGYGIELLLVVNTRQMALAFGLKRSNHMVPSSFSTTFSSLK
jgi:hypothetical protein